MSLCADSNCGYYYTIQGEIYPRCHCPDGIPAPCEYDDEPIEEEDDYTDDEGFVLCPVCGVLTDGVSVCYNCGFVPGECEPGDYKEDWSADE